jgi:hypothetical protein
MLLIRIKRKMLISFCSVERYCKENVTHNNKYHHQQHKVVSITAFVNFFSAITREPLLPARGL